MADRAHKTRQKPTFRIAPPKPRNPLVVPALKRAAGPHRKSRGAERAAERRALARDPERPDDDGRGDD